MRCYVDLRCYVDEGTKRERKPFKSTDNAAGSHQGIEETQSLIGEKIWLPKLDEKVREIVENCVARQAVGNANSPEPMQITPTVDIPWHTVAIDFHGPITNTQQYLLVVTDLYSKFPEI